MIQFKDLYGVDFLQSVKEKHIINRGKKLYRDYLDLKEDRVSGEEYDLIKWWAEELNLNPYFSLIKEDIHQLDIETLEDQVSRIENDPFNLDGDSSFEDEELKKFIEANKNSDLNMAVVFYMKDCLNYIKVLKESEIQEIGFEIAKIGRLGIDPSTDEKYTLTTVKQRSFTGWQMLAWMYVTWKSFNPTMADQLGLDFKDEFHLAKSNL